MTDMSSTSKMRRLLENVWDNCDRMGYLTDIAEDIGIHPLEAEVMLSGLPTVEIMLNFTPDMEINIEVGRNGDMFDVNFYTYGISAHNAFFHTSEQMLDYVREAAKVLGQPSILEQFTDQLAKGWEGVEVCSCCAG